MTIDSSPDISNTDCIRISGLRLTTRIGVPSEERSSPQSVEAHLSLWPIRESLSGLGDGIENTIDYYKVSQEVRQLAAKGERHLIETLADEVADLLLKEFPVRATTVEIRKFILSDTDHVAVTLSKSISPDRQ